MIRNLLRPLLLIGVMLAAGVLAASFLFRELRKEAGCPGIVSAVTRDADAQDLVDHVVEATVAARGVRDGVHLYSVATQSEGFNAQSEGYRTFYFVGQGKPPVVVTFPPRTAQPSAWEFRPSFKFDLAERKLLTLDDLVLGPSRAVSTVREEYPTLSSMTVSLFRGEDCDLGWRVAGTIHEEGEESLKLKARVDNVTGEISLPEGPPAPYENLVDIIPPN